MGQKVEIIGRNVLVPDGTGSVMMETNDFNLKWWVLFSAIAALGGISISAR